MYHKHLKNSAINCLSQEAIPVYDYEKQKKHVLNTCKKRQEFRVAIGKSKWIWYETFNSAYNLREILKDEIVIEFDTENKNKAYEGINFTAINLFRAGIKFSIWEHGGKSPHLHIHNLPISHLEKDKLKLFKKVFIRKFVPFEYLDCVDYSLTGIHLIALEWAFHWKGKYSYKKLLHEFNPNEK